MNLINKKNMILLIILSLVSYFSFKVIFIIENERSGMVFYGCNSLAEVKKFSLEKKYKIIKVDEQYVDRGKASFITLQLNDVPTSCGNLKVSLHFFNEKINYVRFHDIEKKINASECEYNETNKEKIHSSHMKVKIINIKENSYDLIFRDISTDKEVDNWIEKWS